MNKTTSPRRKSFRIAAFASVALATIGGAGAALFAGVTPAQAANIAHQPDTQVAIFMVPLTILVLAMLFEAARTVIRGNLPAEVPVRQPSRQHWTRSGSR